MTLKQRLLDLLDRRTGRAGRASAITALAVSGLLAHNVVLATIPLADRPLFATIDVPGNMALALSVEFPTAISVAHQGNFVAGTRYLGYFDPEKCYRYQTGTEVGDDVSHFFPVGAAQNRRCTATDLTDAWSGNFLNWLTMQTIDPFRWALTGGYRRVDTTTTTILERAWASNQGGAANFPDIPTPNANPLRNRTSPSATDIADHTPLSWNDIRVGVRTLGNKIRFTRTGALANAPTAYTQGMAVVEGTTYDVFVRVKVCDPSATAGSLEPNCVAYGSNYKPEGLIQQYSDRMRFSAFGYLNDGNIQRDGGVLRARQKFVGPLEPDPGKPAKTNPVAEWDATTGVFAPNPDSTDATDTNTAFGPFSAANTVTNSGVINYLNKFGQLRPNSTYKTFDPISELYYAAIRYFKNQGNVPEWTAMGAATENTKAAWIDGFPVITNWDDPIKYHCQKNFVLGIGDANTHADKNVPGATTPTGNEPAKPTAVTNDTTVDAVVRTNKVGELEGLGATLGTTNPYNGCCNNNSALLAGLAFDSHVRDIRPDDATKSNTKGKQSVETFWLDVLEYGAYKNNNQFYLAAKYGGFTVPDGFNPDTHSTALDQSWWSTTGRTFGSPAQNLPDNYFVASRPDSMVAGLTSAFASAASKLERNTTSFSTSLPQVTTTGNKSFAAQYNPEFWTGEVKANSLSFSTTDGTPTQTELWTLSSRLATQLAGTGWDVNRRVATWNPVTSAGVAFRHSAISTAQQAALDTPFRSGDDSATFLNYLRGERANEVGIAPSGATDPVPYRSRTKLLGSIVGSRIRPVGPPAFPYADASNPGYSAFKTAKASRPLMVYFGANDGMLHAVDGRDIADGGGREIFAYVPSPLYSGPTGTPSVNGLAALGKQDFVHYYYVNSTPMVHDVDFRYTSGSTATANDWRSILVGGLGKGGRAYYAIDVTDPVPSPSDPTSVPTESAVAGNVLWEFTHEKMGYTYGEPLVVKTRRWGWVVVFVSGYNNVDGHGYFFLVNPRTGALVTDPIATGSGATPTAPGMAHVNGFVLDRTVGIADALYAGDLDGNVWRLDISSATADPPAPVKIAQLTNSSGVAQAVTSRPTIEVHPGTNRRYVMVGTGRMLATTDIQSTTVQSYYAIRDGSGGRFNASTNLPTGVSFPITRSNLLGNTDPLTGVTYNDPKQMGWVLDLGQGVADLAWRVVSDSANFFGTVAFATLLPNSDPCSPSGESRVYALDIDSGKTQLSNPPLSPGGDRVPIVYSTALPTTVTDLRFFSVGGTARLIGGSDDGTLKSIPGSFGVTSTLRRLNWRELPVTD